MRGSHGTDHFNDSADKASLFLTVLFLSHTGAALQEIDADASFQPGRNTHSLFQLSYFWIKPIQLD